jgi:RHS repeat-associated protein
MKPILSGIPMLKNLTCILLLSSVIHAQNIPTAGTYPTGSVTPLLPSNFTAGIKVNYVRTTVPVIPVLTEASIQPMDYNQTRVSTNYFDGLGRSIQTVDHFASPQTNDIVNVVKYDNLGRAAWHFLPFSKGESTDNGKFKLTAYSDQKDFYKNTLGYTDDNYFYTQTNYEASPLNRVIKSLPQGNSWIGNNRGTTITETPLPAGANIRLFTIAYTPGSVPATSSVYATGDLTVKTTSDEDGNFTEEYTTKDNLLVLKATGKTGNAVKLQTYYVYDDFGLLKYVLPPKATVWLAANSWTLTSAVSKELCFSYVYDGRLRMVVKTIPGGGTQYMVYNLKDELILTQTPTQASKAEYLFYKYDVLGRLIQTGVFNNTNLPADLQALANTSNPGTDAFLAYLFNTNVYGNTSYVNTFTTAKVLTTNYYDDYSFTTRTYNASYMSSLPTGWNTSVSMETNGLLTGTKTVVLDGAATANTLLTVNFYNDKGRLLQSQAQNYKGDWNIITNSYDFIGQQLGTYTEINNPQATDIPKVTTIEVINYDQGGRVTKVWHSVNGQPYKPFPHNAYDEVGRLTTKTFAENQDPGVVYEYNVRGWLTGINKDYCLYKSTDQTFGMEISYDYGYTNNYFNGDIAGIKWRNSGTSNELRSYGYIYDSYNRLKSGDFVVQVENKNQTITPWSSAVKDFSASNMLYDENGNLQSMKQMGLNLAGQKIVLDDLTYGYTANSNKLLSVSESASSQSKSPTTYDNLGDFRDVAGTTDYTYNQNGNMLTDANKSLTFTYDELINKTRKVSKGTQNVDYLYDATGNKLQKKVSPGTVTTTDYLGSAVYINNSLSFINCPEGRIRYNATSPTPYIYDYFIKDHLGSTRSIVTYTDGAITGFAKSASTSSNEVKYIATSEPENATKENQLFDNVDITRSAKPTNKTSTDNYVAKISSKNSKTAIGPDITIKVMTGDKVKISAEALFIPEKINTSAIAQDAINNFISAFTTAPALVAEGVNTATSGSKNLANAILNMQKQNASTDAPKAFLNYILYDEQMNMIPEASGALQVKNKDGWQTLETDQIEIPQNGFLRVFSSNMEAAPVSIDNTTLAAIPGKLVEEYNYYPYGLVFGASSAASTIKKTDYLYNGKELQHNEFGAGNGLELEDYGARLYDPQVGRWNAVDPMAEKFSSYTPYNYCLDNPMNMVDLDGMESTYNWETKKYENEKGQEVSWGDVQKEYGIDPKEKNSSNDGDQDGGNDKKKDTKGGNTGGIPEPLTPDTSLLTGKGRNENVSSNQTETMNTSENSDLPWLGPFLVIAGQPWLSKRFITPGSSPGTSIASTVLNKVLPFESTVRLPSIISNSSGTRIVWTRSVGKFAGRWVPFVGWTITAYDFTKYIAIPMSNGNAQYIESNKKSGNWINNLPH